MTASNTTVFRGKIFRNPMEARWLAFWEQLGWACEYEPFRAVMGAGDYVPDFFLEDIGVWIEIRHDFGFFENFKHQEFVAHYGQPLLCISGEPEPGRYLLKLVAPRHLELPGKISRALLAENALRPRELWLIQDSIAVSLSVRIKVRPSTAADHIDSQWIRKAMIAARTLVD